MPVQTSTVSPACAAYFLQPFPKAYMLQRGLAPGQTVYAQFYGYGASGERPGLSPGLAFTIWP